MACLKIWNLRAGVLDLGIYDSLFWNMVETGNWRLAFWPHIQPLALLEALPYAVFRSPYTLVTLQAAFVSSPLLVFAFLPREHSGAKLFSAATFAFILFFPVWFNALFDFHLDHIAIFLQAVFAVLCLRGRPGVAVGVNCLLCLVKEPFALVAVFNGLYLALRWKRPVHGLIGAAAGAFWFWFCITVLQPEFAPAGNASQAQPSFAWLGSGPLEMIGSILSHPIDIATATLSDPLKVKYLLALLGALAFVPLLAPLELIPALPILALSLLSRHPNHVSLDSHYTAGLIVPLILAFAAGWDKINAIGHGRWRQGAKILATGIVLAGHVALSPSPFSRLFLTDKVFSYGYSAYLPDARTQSLRAALEEHIPSDPEAVVSVQNSVFTHRLAARHYFGPFPIGVASPGLYPIPKRTGRKGTVWAQYVVLDFKRPWYVGEDGCGWRAGTGADAADLLAGRGFTVGTHVLPWAGCLSEGARDSFINAATDALRRSTVLYANDGLYILGMDKNKIGQ
jgi:uncharacterized membrane protein